MRFLFILSFFIFFVSCSETEVKPPPDKKVVRYTVCIGVNNYQALVDCVNDEINLGYQPYGHLSETTTESGRYISAQPMVMYAKESSNSE